MKLFSLSALILSVGLLIYGVWAQSVSASVAGALVLVIGVLSATVVDLSERQEVEGDDDAC